MKSIKKRVTNSKKISEEFDEHKALSLYYRFLNCIEEGEYQNFKDARQLFAQTNSTIQEKDPSKSIFEQFKLDIKISQSSLKQNNKRKKAKQYDQLYRDGEGNEFERRQKEYCKGKKFYNDEEEQINFQKNQEAKILFQEVIGDAGNKNEDNQSFEINGAAGKKNKSLINDFGNKNKIQVNDLLDKSSNNQNLSSDKPFIPKVKRQYLPDSDENRVKADGDSDFTASFYGPVFGSHIELEESEQEGSISQNSEKQITERSYKSEKQSQSAKSQKSQKNEPKGDDHGYKLVRETHSEYDSEEVADDYRIFILTYKDNEKRTVLHTAAKLGDKYFTTMILKEAEDLGILDKIIDLEDQNGATPLYLLCEQGYRPEKSQAKYLFNRWDLAAKNSVKKRPGVNFEGYKDNYDNLSTKTTLPPIKELEKILDPNYQEEVKIKMLLKHGLAFTVEEPMVDLIDDSEQHQEDNECKVPSRSLLIDFLVEGGASTNHQSQVNKMTPIHWLAYQGDYRGMVVILNKNKSHLEIARSCCQTEEQYFEINGAPEAFLTKDDQTPADIAGTRKNFKTLGCYLTYFLNCRDKIEQTYITDKEKGRFEKSRFTKDRWKTFDFKEKIQPQHVELVFFNSENFKKKQISYLRMAYWAFFIGNFAQDQKTRDEFEIRMKKIIYFFVIDLGVNPFIHSYQGKSLIHACIEANQPELLEELLSHIYWVQDEKEAELLKESVQIVDEVGNNIYHQIFQLKGNLRDKFLGIVFDYQYYLKINYTRKQKGCFSGKICSSSGIVECDQCKILKDPKEKCRAHKNNFYNDDFYKDVILVPINGFQQSNYVGLLPYQLEHDYPPEEMDDIKTDDEIFNKLCHQSDDLTKLYIESFEADYVIETEETFSTDNKAIYIWNQLIECNLEKDRDFWVYQTDLDQRICCKSKKAEFQPKRFYFVIKITNQDIDEKAEELKLLCDLDNSQVRLPYRKEMSQAFTQFDDRQRYECVMHILTEEIDFKNLVGNGIITKHYPLHKLNFYDRLKDSYMKNGVQLSRRLMCGNWKKFLEPIHQMKRYMGERYAFYYFFLMTFNSFMIVPAIVGGILFLYQVSNSYDKPLPERVDTIWNAPFCILMAIWSSFFVEIWKQKESDMIIQWNLDDGKDLAQTDERKGKFRSEKSYDPIQDSIVKIPRGNRDQARILNRLFTITMIIITVATMVGFEYIIDKRNQTNLKDINISLNPLDEYLSQAKQNKTRAEQEFEKLMEEQIKKNQNNPSLIGKVTVFLSKAVLMIDWIGLIYSFVLAFYGTCYEKIARKIVELYNFQFKKDYNDQLARQIFYFSVVNEYLPLGFMAFYKQSFPALWSMLVSRLAISPIKGMFGKLINLYCNSNRRQVKSLQNEYEEFQKKLKDERQIPERQVHMMLQLDVNLKMKENDLDLNQNFMEIVIQFGKISLFAPCFPLAGLIVLINNYYTILAGIEDIDIYKRTLPEFSQGIGSFIGFIESLSYLSVCTNMAILVWTSDRIPNFFVVEFKLLTIVQFTLMIIGVEHLLFIIKIILDQYFYIDSDILKMQKTKKKAIENQYHQKLKELQQANINQKKAKKKDKGKKYLSDDSSFKNEVIDDILSEKPKLRQDESKVKPEEEKTLDSIKLGKDEIDDINNEKDGKDGDQKDMRRKRPKKVINSNLKKHTRALMIKKTRKIIDEEKYIEFQLFEDDERDQEKLKKEALIQRFEFNVKQ